MPVTAVSIHNLNKIRDKIQLLNRILDKKMEVARCAGLLMGTANAAPSARGLENIRQCASILSSTVYLLQFYAVLYSI